MKNNILILLSLALALSCTNAPLLIAMGQREIWAALQKDENRLRYDYAVLKNGVENRTMSLPALTDAYNNLANTFTNLVGQNRLSERFIFQFSDMLTDLSADIH